MIGNTLESDAGAAARVWFKSLAHLGYRRVIVRERVLNGSSHSVTSRVPIVIELLEPSQISAYNAFRQPRDETGTAKRFAVGDKCFVARHEGEIVGAVWTATSRGWSEYLAEWIVLSPDEAYAYDAFTAREFRGMGILPALTAAMDEHYRVAGFRRIIGLTVPENRSSMTSDISFDPIGTMGSVGFRGIRRSFLRMSNGSRPPGEVATGSGMWDRTLENMEGSGHYLDQFLADLKRNAYLELIERWGGVPQKGRVLKTDLFEEAMGPDAFLLQLKAARLLVGMDISLGAAARASTRDDRMTAKYMLADARCLPFACSSFDLIISPSTLDHFHDPAELGASLRELRRTLAPKGRLIITLDNKQNIFDPLLRLASRLGLTPYFIGKSYTAGELRQELEAAGFTVSDTTAIIHNPRLTAVGAVSAARKLGFAPFTRLVHRAIGAMQSLQNTRLRYYSGSFVAALAVPSDK